MSQDGRRRSDEIEDEIFQARARLDETLHQIEEKLSPEQLMNMTYDYLRHGGAERITTSLGRTLRENPLPVMVTGIGLGWLVLAQRNSGHEASREALPRHAGYPGSTMPQTRLHGEEVHGHDEHETVSGAGTTTLGHDPAALGATPQHHTERHGSAEGMTHKAQQMAQEMRHRAQHMGGQVKHRAQHMGDKVRDRASHLDEQRHAAMEAASHRMHDAGSQTTHFVREHPLVAGALGVAVGAVLGSLFSPTRAENRHLGHMRDEALHRAEEVGQEQAERAQEKFHEGVDRIKQEARERRSEAVGQARSDVESRVGRPSNEASYVENPSSEERFAKAGQAESNRSSRPGSDAARKGDSKSPGGSS